MAEIPFHLYVKEHFPRTSKSTVHYWAVQAFYHNKGPFAGRITRMGGRWYYKVNEDPVVCDVVKKVKETLRK